MSGKLDQSLDEIVSTHRRTSGRNKTGTRGRRAGQAGRPAAAAAPVGGVHKNPRHAKGAVKAIPTGPSAGVVDSKIQVSNLPKDVDEAQIKDYVSKSVGPIKKVELSYGPGGVSRGVATIIFARADGAAKAVEKLNGILVDGRPMKVEVILDARRAAEMPPPKTLSDRVSQPKAQPKSAANTKATATAGASTRGKGRTRGRGGRNPRPAKKSAEELDSEMADYWETGNAAPGTEVAGASNGAPAAANGDANMDDEIL